MNQKTVYRLETLGNKVRNYLDLFPIIIYFIFRHSFYISLNGFFGGW